MAGRALRVAWCRFGVTFRRRWGGYLALAVLIGLAGGIAMSSMVAARRTYSSYPGFLAGTKPSDLVVQPFTTPAYSPGLVRQLGRLPHVRGVAVAVPFNAITLTSRGKLGTVLLAQVQLAATIASPHGLYVDQDRVTITSGRRAHPARADEVVASPDAATLLHLRVGSHLRVGLISSYAFYAVQGWGAVPARWADPLLATTDWWRPPPAWTSRRSRSTARPSPPWRHLPARQWPRTSCPGTE